jgi:hypothetical protein
VIALSFVLLVPACSVIMGLLGFWLGRCARKLPIIDDKLPWTLRRSQISAATEDPAKLGPGPDRWPRESLSLVAHPEYLSYSSDIAHPSTDWLYLRQ